jgi:predicted PurR-regulated permease PerM
MLLLTILTILLLLAFVAVLAVGVAKIMWTLESIGNAPTSTPGSLLANIRWGVRAIEQQTAAIEAQSRRLNSALETAHGRLEQLRQHLQPGRAER